MLPHLSQQNVFLGIPLVLLPEEVVLLVEKRTCYRFCLVGMKGPIFPQNSPSSSMIQPPIGNRRSRSCRDGMQKRTRLQRLKLRLQRPKRLQTRLLLLLRPTKPSGNERHASRGERSLRLPRHRLKALSCLHYSTRNRHLRPSGLPRLLPRQHLRHTR